MELQEQLNKAEVCLRRAFTKIEILARKLADSYIRYNRSLLAGCRLFRYKLRMRIITLTGVMNRYFEYVRRRRKEIKTLRRRILQENWIGAFGLVNFDFYGIVGFFNGEHGGDTNDNCSEDNDLPNIDDTDSAMANSAT
jgi:hypothetical protein